MDCDRQFWLRVSVLWMSLATMGGVSRCDGGTRSGTGACYSVPECCWGPNDYCSKALPCVRCKAANCCSCNDYRCKPLPCVKCPPGCARCDDYVRKCPPCPPWQCRLRGYPCGIEPPVR